MITIRDNDGNPQDVYAGSTGGMIDILVRAQNAQAWEAIAKAQGIMVESEDEDGNAIPVPAPGIYIDVIGPVVVTPGQYDDEGNELVPPVLDTRHHVNIRIAGKGLAGRWAEMLVHWAQNGNPNTNNKANERTQVRSGLAIIDPESITTPTRIWFGS